MKKEEINKNLLEMSMASRAEEALKKAVAETIADHKRTGDPIVVWRDGKVVKIPAEQIEIREPGAKYKALDTKGK
ncbi:MAG: hypothetical protein JRJ38_10610 [Deltaproteobacteria bacterium]|nr:hypothetical protein [Deltaproteobacteria bacterium]